MLYRFIIKPIFFLIDPERVHDFVLKIFSRMKFIYPLMRFLYAPPGKGKHLKIGGLNFKNRLGLAAGFDKNGIAIPFWYNLGFSHIEVGTVTPLPQPGNDKPRIFRLPKDNALINRLGFNNMGADKVRENIIKGRKQVGDDFIIGVNIGKNKITPMEEAFSDYKKCFEKLYDVADYFTINISSPNTERLRELHNEEALEHLLNEIGELDSKLAGEMSLPEKNVFLKIAPDIDEGDIKTIYNLVCKYKLSGIIATNTTISRDNLGTKINEAGGLSGQPLAEKSDFVLKKLNELSLKSNNKKVTLFGVGGVFDRHGYENKLNNGAELVQVYTGFIYKGPSILKEILK